MKKSIWYVAATGVLVFSMGTFVKACSESQNRQKEERQRPQQMPIEWCVSVCREDIFETMHNQGSSWGTGSSSLDGMTQNDTFNTVIQHCREVYKEGCIQINNYDNGDTWHYSGYKRAKGGKL